MRVFGGHTRLLAFKRRLDQSPHSALVFRYFATLVAVVAVTQLAHHSPFNNVTRGVISMAAVLACAWYGGVGPALLLAPLLLLQARLVGDESERWTALSSDEVMGLTVITLVCVSLGLAGRYRRRIRAVTEQHAQKLRDQARALSQAPIIFRDVDGRVTEWNAGAERLFGWTSAEAAGRLLHELLQTRFDTSWPEVQSQLVQSGQWQGEVVHRHQDGRELHVAMQWILYQDSDGNPIGVAEMHNDVSDLRRAEAAIREADRRKDEFLAMLAHELRNPLAPIRTGLEVMKIAANDQQLIDQTRGIMERQMQQLVALVDDLLDVSRISRGKLELRKCQTTLSEVIASAVEAARSAIDAAEHTLTVSVPQSPIHLHADPHRLAQVLSNLLDNAAKYTPRGGSISLTASQDRAEVVVAIKDTGVGIPPDMLAGVFEMFTRVERTERTNPGLGIGLALVKSIVEMHDGRVEARSEGLGRGTEIRLRLPLVLNATATDSEPPPAGESNGHSPRRVLVVDDNEAAANLLAVIVEKFGHQVRIAYDGEQAIAVAARFRPEIVLMDLGMPKMDGYDAAHHIRQQLWGQAITLVAVTGWGQDGHKQKAKAAGFDHHLVKPADPAQLQQLLAAAKPPLNHHAAPEPSFPRSPLGTPHREAPLR